MSDKKPGTFVQGLKWEFDTVEPSFPHFMGFTCSFGIPLLFLLIAIFGVNL